MRVYCSLDPVFSDDTYEGKSQYHTPVGPSIYIPTANPHIKGDVWEFRVVTLESHAPTRQIPQCDPDLARGAYDQ